jgi:hypothetical protein
MGNDEPASFSEVIAAEKHMPQLQHNMWVRATSQPGVAEAPRSSHRNQSTGDAAVAARARDGAKLAVHSVLTSDESAILRERLVAQLVAIHSMDDAAL